MLITLEARVGRLVTLEFAAWLFTRAEIAPLTILMDTKPLE